MSLVIIIFSFMPSLLKAQKGTIKIFSEIKEVSVYLDEELKGVDMTKIDSVIAGSHYLKITKDNANIYNEIITIKPNEVNTILVKNTPDLQNKLLASKTDEIHQYKMGRLAVMLSTNYITETNSKSNSAYFPGYYAVLGGSKTNSVSVTSSVTDWFITKGGTNKISEETFSTITNYQRYFEKVKAQKRQDRKSAGTGLLIAFGGLGLIAGGIALLPKPWEGSTDFQKILPIGMFSLSFISVMGGLGMQNPFDGSYLTMDEVVNEAYVYNQNFKKKLGLPENFEPKE